MPKLFEIGRLLRAGTGGCVIGCKTARMGDLCFGGMVQIPGETDLQIYGLITAIHVDDDGLVRQLVTAEDVSPDVIADNRRNRNAPVELDVLFIGFEQHNRIYHLLPPPPPGVGCHLPLFCGGGLPVHRCGPIWVFPAYPAGGGSAYRGAAGRAFAAGSPGSWRWRRT